MSFMMDHDTVAQNFAAAYFRDTHKNIKELKRRYRANSLLNVDGTEVTGADNIEEKLVWFFDDTKTQNIRTLSQPSDRDVLVIVTGTMVSGSELGIPVSHTFLLKMETMTLYVQNHVIAL